MVENGQNILKCIQKGNLHFEQKALKSQLRKRQAKSITVDATITLLKFNPK